MTSRPHGQHETQMQKEARIGLNACQKWHLSRHCRLEFSKREALESLKVGLLSIETD